MKERKIIMPYWLQFKKVHVCILLMTFSTLFACHDFHEDIFYTIRMSWLSWRYFLHYSHVMIFMKTFSTLFAWNDVHEDIFYTIRMAWFSWRHFLHYSHVMIFMKTFFTLFAWHDFHADIFYTKRNTVFMLVCYIIIKRTGNETFYPAATEEVTSLHVRLSLHHFNVGRVKARKRVVTNIKSFFVCAIKSTKPTATPFLTAPKMNKILYNNNIHV